MSRQAILLATLGAILVVAAFFFLLYQPKNEELDEIRAETESIEAQQDDVRERIGELRGIREQAPELESLLEAGEAVVPDDPALPSLLRQLEQAASDSQVTLVSIAPSRPTTVDEEDEEDDAEVEGTPAGDLARVSVTVEVDGTYFQPVDFLRRIEDPGISPRGVLWNTVSITEGDDELPELRASLNADVFARVPAADDEEADDGEEAEDEAGDDEENEEAGDEEDATDDEAGTDEEDADE